MVFEKENQYLVYTHNPKIGELINEEGKNMCSDNRTTELKMDPLLEALLKRDFDKAQDLISNQGMRLKDIDEVSFRRALYEFLKDYEMIVFLVKNKLNRFYFPRLDCLNGNYIWGVIGRAYALKNYNTIEVLFSAGFNFVDYGQYISNKRAYELWKYVTRQMFDKKIIDLALSYGYDRGLLMSLIDSPEYASYRYLESDPEIEWKGYSLGAFRQEVERPKEPHFGFFTSRKEKEYLTKRYEKQLRDYYEKNRMRDKYISSITQEEWALIREEDRLQEEAIKAMDEFAQRIRAQRNAQRAE